MHAAVQEFITQDIFKRGLSVALSLVLIDASHSEEFAKKPAEGHSSMAYNPVEFKQMRVTDTWKKYDGILSWGKGQCLAVVDDGCDLTVPEWKTTMPWGPKVVGGYDSVDLDDSPARPGPQGYHGTSVGYPSSLNYQGRLGVAYNDSVVHIRAVTRVHLRKDESRTLARGLQWVITNCRKYNITAVNLSPVDDRQHAEPVPSAIDEKLAQLRELGIWVSAPCGNNNHTNGISWPACQPCCFAIGATKPSADQAYLDRFSNTDILVPAKATSSSNAQIAGCAMVLREAIEKSGFDWRSEGATLPEAMMVIFKKTGVMVADAGTGLRFSRLDLLAAVDYVFAAVKRKQP